jgi:hypothetical protein
MRCRKNYRDLTTVEKDRFVQALHFVKAAGVVGAYADEHEMHFNHSIHFTSHFLPWHRDFVWRFENELRAYHPAICIPYWNSTVDTSPSDPLWDNAFLGQFDAAWNLNRALGSATLPTPGALADTLSLFPTYDVFWPQVQDVMHNAPHNWVAGAMATKASPHDPVFFLHHCWIDLIWAQWQLAHPGAGNFIASGAGVGIDDPMMGVPRTPRDVIDHRTINIYHYPMGMQEDAPVVTLDTPAVNFLDVPEGETRLAAAVLNLDACEGLTLSVAAGPAVLSGPATTVFGVLADPVMANPELDPKGRIWLSYKGTANGDSATGTVKILCDNTGDQFDVSLTANTVRRPTAALVMVLDQSNSMTFDSGLGAGIQRQDVLKFSAPTAVVVLEDEHAMGVCTFDHDAHPVLGVTPAAGAGKLTINAAIAGYAPNPNGWTSIGEGVAFAHGLLAPVTGYDVKAMVVLTDGQENPGPYTRRSIADVTDLINSLNGRVYAIGLGRAEVLNPAALQSLCSGNQGYMLMTGDLTPDATYRVAKYYQQIFAGVTTNEIVLDPEGFVAPGQEHRIPFWLNEADISAKAILLTPAPWAIQWVLETPEGDIIDPGVALAHPMAAFDIGLQVSLYRVGLPIPLAGNTAQAGRWYARIRVDDKGWKRYLSSLDHYPSLAAATNAHGIRYNFNVHAWSNLRLRAALSQSGNEPGATMRVRAFLTEYGVPVARRAACRVELLRPDSTGATLAMAEVDPGVFDVTFVADFAGIYRFRIVAEGKTFRGRDFTREQTLTGAVWRGGDRPPLSGRGDPANGKQCLCHTLECLLGQKSILALLARLGIDAAEVRRCLDDCCRRPPSTPSRPPLQRPDLVSRLRAVIRDDRVLATVMSELDAANPEIRSDAT